MVRSTKPSLLRRLGALVAAAAMLVVLPAGVSTASAASDDADMLTVTMTRTDTLGDEVSPTPTTRVRHSPHSPPSRI